MHLASIAMYYVQSTVYIYVFRFEFIDFYVWLAAAAVAVAVDFARFLARSKTDTKDSRANKKLSETRKCCIGYAADGDDDGDSQIETNQKCNSPLQLHRINGTQNNTEPNQIVSQYHGFFSSLPFLRQYCTLGV